MSQQSRRLLLGPALIRVQHHLVVLQVVPSQSARRVTTLTVAFCSPSSHASLTWLADHVSGEVKLTASGLKSEDESLDQGGLESSSDQDLTVRGHFLI